MHSLAQTVSEYLDEPHDKWGETLRRVRDLCRDNLPGFEETMAYRMPSYKRNGEVEVAFARQRQYLAIYILRTAVMDAHETDLAACDTGKGCVRFAKPEKVDFELVKRLLRETAASTGPVC